MRYILLLVVAIGISFSGLSQTDQDALRYSTTTFGGTARSTALAGSMNALGADFSTLSQNPAGVGLYRATEITFAPELLNTSVSSDYLGNSYTENKYDLTVNNAGLVIHSNLGSETSRSNNEGWIGINFAFGLNRLSDFNQRTYFKGLNTANSILDKYTNQLNEAPSGERDNYEYVDFETVAAYNAFLINPTDSTFSSFENVAQVDRYGGVNQEGTIETSGSINEYLLSMGANYQHKLYLGATVGIPVINFERDFNYTESEISNDSIPGFREFTLRNKLETSGVGANLKVGMIYRATNWLRLGGSIHTPSYFSLTDEYSSTIESNLDTASYTQESPKGNFEYNFANPWRVQGGIGFIIKKRGFISFDYEFVDYSSANFSFSSEYQDEASATNQNINSKYGAAHNLSAGGELRLGDFRLRVGYAFQGSPFQDSFDGDRSRQSFTGGFGYRGEHFFMDFAYRRDLTDGFFSPYTLANESTPSTTNSIAKNHFTTTIGFRF